MDYWPIFQLTNILNIAVDMAFSDFRNLFIDFINNQSIDYALSEYIRHKLIAFLSYHAFAFVELAQQG